MKGKLGTLGLMALLAFAPATAGAYSFGTFQAGEQITQIQLSAAGSDAVTYDASDGSFVIRASVSEITTSLSTYNVTLGDVILDVTLEIDPGTLLLTSGVTDKILFGLVGTVVADVTITDVADSGTLLLSGEWLGAEGSLLEFSVTQFGSSISGSVGGDFTSTGGDASFANAFTSGGDLLLNLTEFDPLGNPADLCNLTTFNICAQFAGNDVESFTAQPTGSITPLLTPEPGTFSLLGLGMIGLAALRRRS